MSTSVCLPEGLTLEQLDLYAAQRERERRRENYHRHPERVERNRITTYTNFLQKHGKVVIPRPADPWPWTPVQKEILAYSVYLAMRGEEAMDNA